MRSRSSNALTAGPGPAGAAEGSYAFESRRCLLDLSIGFVEDLQRAGGRPGKGPEGFCSVFQVCLPYRGLFVWHVGGEDVVGDSNQIVFVRAGEPYRVSGPNAGGYGELIITPDPEVLGEIAHVNGGSLFDHPAFRGRSWRAEPRLQHLRSRLLHRVSDPSPIDRLEAEEAVLLLLRSALDGGPGRSPSCGAATARLIRRTKEYLDERLATRLRLVDVSREVGASPSYLTDVFRRVEGIPLHRYVTHLRLARALVDLRHAGDLTALALNLGFSSHSHFSFAFRRAFGSTPSEFRHNAQHAHHARPRAAVRLRL